MLASASIPLAYPRRYVEGRPFVDGGTSPAHNLAAHWLKETGSTAICSIFLADRTIQDRASFREVMLLQVRPMKEDIARQITSVKDFSAATIERLIAWGTEDADSYYDEINGRRSTLMRLKQQGDVLDFVDGELQMRAG